MINVSEIKVPIAKPIIGDEEIENVVEVLKSGIIAQGPKVAEFEQKFAEWVGADYGVAVNSGTAALHVALLSCGIGKGDEVITTPITFAASANCALYCGAKPVFADINEKTYNIDPENVKKLTTDKTKAVVAVDFTGQSVELDELMAHCKENNLVLIEDGAHVIGTKYKGQPNGSIADMTTFSFHPVKTVTGGEGGAVMTNSEEYYQKLLLARSHGITRDTALMEEEPHGGWYYEQVSLGYNYRMTDIQAGLLISQLDKLPMFSDRRKEIVAKYNEAFLQIPEIQVQEEIPESDTTRHLYILRIRPEMLTINRREFFDALAAENIMCNVHYIPTYYFPHYQRLGYGKGLCPKAEKLYDEMMSLPLYYGMTDTDVEDVITAVKKIVDYYKKSR